MINGYSHHLFGYTIKFQQTEKTLLILVKIVKLIVNNLCEWFLYHVLSSFFWFHKMKYYFIIAWYSYYG